MKKEFDLNKFKKNRKVFCNEMKPKGFILYAWLIALGLGGVLCDFENIFNIELKYSIGFCGFIFFCSYGYLFAWICYCTYYAIRTTYLQKKYPNL